LIMLPHHNIIVEFATVHLRLTYFIIIFFFYCSGAPRDLHSFPTRRSSDLRFSLAPDDRHRSITPEEQQGPNQRPDRLSGRRGGRSEEHTSELQSLAYLVCRLLLEKKKKKKKHSITIIKITIVARIFTTQLI